MKITIPELALVVLVGPSGSGKSSFAREHFQPTEVISSDYCRGLVSDDENDQAATEDAFHVLHYIAEKRLARGKLTVIDATNVQPESRKHLLKLAREYHCLAIPIVFNLSNSICHERNRLRPDRNFGSHVVRNQAMQLRKSLRGLKDEGFHNIYILNTPEQVAAVELERTRLWTNLRHEHGPFDIIGDVHGCFDELHELLQRLGYEITLSEDSVPSYQVTHPEGRRAIFVGDLVDRGPKVPEVLHLLATQGHTYFDRDHTWHMQTLVEICQADQQLLLATPHLVVDVTDPASVQEGVSWWEQLTGRGGEGMVVKPLEFIAQGRHGPVQPAVKCRGPEYLRIIYGPEYDVPENLERLRMRGLSMKRLLAMREFALGVEALERFVHGEPLRSVHECVFGVLALESEPVDPRL